MNNLSFPVSLYGAQTKVNDVLTKQRCRIFYKYKNRNGTYITDQFAEELVKTLHYVPVKGIYEDGDYSDHGISRSEGKIYGIVPENNNFAWEKHLDKDGVEREYACTDVYLFSALYPEVSEISNKGESMELYSDSLEYHTEKIDGSIYVVFDHGSFLGLQVLGDDVEPCFEGASFFALQEQISTTLEAIKSFTSLGGKKNKMKFNFRLSDSEKLDKLFELLNPSCNEEGGWIVDYCILDVYDDYALTYNYSAQEYERVYYSKEENEITVGDKIKVYIVDVTENEYSVLSSLRKLNGETYAALDPVLEGAKENFEKINTFSAQIEELNNTISTLKSEGEEKDSALSELQTKFSELQTKFSETSTQLEELVSYKSNIENQRKDAIIKEYASVLAEDVLKEYMEKKDQYSIDDLDMHLAYELKKSGGLGANSEKGNYVLKDQGNHKTAVEEILGRYVR